MSASPSPAHSTALRTGALTLWLIVCVACSTPTRVPSRPATQAPPVMPPLIAPAFLDGLHGPYLPYGPFTRDLNSVRSSPVQWVIQTR